MERSTKHNNGALDSHYNLVVKLSVHNDSSSIYVPPELINNEVHNII